LHNLSAWGKQCPSIAVNLVLSILRGLCPSK
jgi:hypothetical protein